MGNRPDRRVRRTEEAIERALLSLVVEKGYETITVREIIDRADVGRSTFYAHYRDKQDLLVACLDRIEHLLVAPPGAGGARRGFGFDPGLFAAVAEQRELYRAFARGRGASALVQSRIERLLTDAMRERLVALLPAGHVPLVPLDVVVRAMVGAYMAMVAGWLDGEIGAGRSPAQMEEMFRALARPAVASALAAEIP